MDVYSPRILVTFYCRQVSAISGIGSVNERHFILSLGRNSLSFRVERCMRLVIRPLCFRMRRNQENSRKIEFVALMKPWKFDLCPRSLEWYPTNMRSVFVNLIIFLLLKTCSILFRTLMGIANSCVLYKFPSTHLEKKILPFLLYSVHIFL